MNPSTPPPPPPLRRFVTPSLPRSGSTPNVLGILGKPACASDIM